MNAKGIFDFLENEDRRSDRSRRKKTAGNAYAPVHCRQK